MELNLTVPQSDYFVSNAPYLAGVAGFGAGKTEAAIVKILKRKFEYPAIDQAYLAPTYDLIRSIFYPRVAEYLSELGHTYGINQSKHEIHIQGYGMIKCQSMNDPNSIVGWECGDATMDEFDLLPIDKALLAMNKVSARCRQKFPDGKPNQKQIITTPEGFKATYRLFKKEPLPNSQLVRMSTRSNAINLPEGFIEDRVKQYTPQLVEAYIEGEFVNLTSGSVYPNFDRILNNTDFEIAKNEALHIGMDFNVYKMYAGVHVVRKGIPYLLDEFVNVVDTPAMVTSIKERYPNHTIVVYPDASGDNKSTKGASLSDIKILRAAGFRINAPKSNPLIRDRVNSVNAKICDANFVRTYFVNVDKCPVATEAFEQQVYDRNGVPDKSADLDHPNDANGYFIHRRWPILGNVSGIVTGKDISNELDHSI